MYKVHAKPVSFVAVRMGMASRAAAASEKGVSLIHSTVK